MTPLVLLHPYPGGRDVLGPLPGRPGRCPHDHRPGRTGLRHGRTAGRLDDRRCCRRCRRADRAGGTPRHRRRHGALDGRLHGAGVGGPAPGARRAAHPRRHPRGGRRARGTRRAVTRRSMRCGPAVAPSYLAGLLPRLVAHTATADVRAELAACAARQPDAALVGALGALAGRPDRRARTRRHQDSRPWSSSGPRTW